MKLVAVDMVERASRFNEIGLRNPSLRPAAPRYATQRNDLNKETTCEL